MHRIKNFILENIIGILLVVLMIVLVLMTIYTMTHIDIGSKEKFMKACMKVEDNQDICDYEYLKTLRYK